MMQMSGIRVAATVLILAAFYGVEKLDFSHQPFGHDVVIAAFLFIVAAIATVSIDQIRRGQRQIQIEEGTWVEAEWNKPRKLTDLLLDPTGNNLKTYRKAASFMALGLVICVIMAVDAPWKQDTVNATMLLAGLALAMLLAFLFWRNRPRFKRVELTGMGYMCGLTLFIYNFHQYKAGLGFAHGTWPAAVILFNLVVVLVYAAFISVFIWKRDRESQGHNLSP